MNRAALVPALAFALFIGPQVARAEKIYRIGASVSNDQSKAIGLKFPWDILLRAGEVIE
jgi:hypothetical protein